MLSCSEESINLGSEDKENAPQLVDKFFLGDAVQVEDLGEGSYLYGDIIFNEGQLSDTSIFPDENPEPNALVQAKLALAGGVKKWPDNTVIYVLDDNLTNNQIRVTENSMQEWRSKTNVRFKERTNENYYLTIRNNGQSCNCGSASLGLRSRGVINIGTRTSEYVMIHEIGHTLGFLHEQNRSDRDNYVRVLFENIVDGAASQFTKSQNSQNLGEFDIKSTMMYDSYTFSKNGDPTIVELSTGRPYPTRSGSLSRGYCCN